MIGLLLLMELSVVPNDDPFMSLSFLAGLSAPVFAIVGFALPKFSGGPVSAVAIVALVFGSLATCFVGVIAAPLSASVSWQTYWHAEIE